MREISFRAWDKFNGNMSYSIERKYLTAFFSNCDALIAGGNKLELMQFTGLKDRNGKEIYEGDIVLCQDDANCFPEEYNEEKDEYIPTGKYEVVYQADQGYAAFELKDSPCEDMNALAYACANSIEVIGNIYENKELLK
jgi:uncharacterized phage protein (TIGR01671 family)